MKKKRVIIDVNHAFDVHFLKNLYHKLVKEGHFVKVVASKKPLSYELLTHLDIPFTKIGTYGTTSFSKLLKLIWLDIKMFFIALRFKPDVLIGHVSFRAAHIGWLLRKKTILLTDTEHAKEQIILFKGFCDFLITPSCFLDDLGKKQTRVDSIFELAYLHPSYFKPNKTVLNDIGIKDNETFFVLRFVAWDATHDLNEHGFSEKGKRILIDHLTTKGKVFITAEYELPKEFEPYRITVSPEKIHDLLYYATMYIGEGGSMASEAAVLGTASIYVNTLTMGYIESLEHDYGLLNHFTEDEPAIKHVINLLKTPNIKALYRSKRDQLLSDTIDINSYLYDIIVD